MSRQKKQTLLEMDIAETLHGAAIERRASQLFSSSISRQLLLTSIALAALQPGIAAALSVGDLKVHSSLGQPFVATTTARIGPGEFLSPGCVAAVADLPGGYASPAALSTAVEETSAPGKYPVRITSRAPMYEPMYEIQLRVSCAGSMAVARNYVVMLNLTMTSSQPQIEALPATNTPASTANIPSVDATTVLLATTQNAPSSQPATTASDQNSGATASNLEITHTLITSPLQDAGKGPIQTGRDYSVQQDDTLLKIAQRVERPAGMPIRQVADKLFQDNPAAFIGSNPDLIKMGFVIKVPNRQALLDSTNDALVDARSVITTDASIATASPAKQTKEAFQPTGSVVKLAASDINSEKTAPELPAEPASQAATVATTDAVAAVNGPDSSIPTADIMETLDAAALNSIDQAPADQSPLAAAAASAAVTTISPASDIPVADPATSGNTPDFTETTQRSAQADSVAQTALVASASAATKVRPNALIAAGSGLLVGCFLAALLLGRGLITSWRPRRSRRNDEMKLASRRNKSDAQLDETEADETEGLIGAFSATAEEFPRDPTDPDTSAEPDTTSAIFGADLSSTDIDLDVSAEAIAEATSDREAGPAADSKADSTEFSPTNYGVPVEELAPRISLRESTTQADIAEFDLSDMEEPLESTHRYSDPSMLAEHEPPESSEHESELDGTGTMHNLFGAQPEIVEAAAVAYPDTDVTSTMHDIFSEQSDAAQTAEIPGLAMNARDREFAQVSFDDTSTLQTLSKSLANGNADDELSKTLTQALGLLERDYEDELSSSQILEQKDIQKAFAEQAAKDN